ncbi:tetratricopeptide repeat protein [soil metagenome]
MFVLPLLLAFTPLSAEEEARRDALTRYGVARMQARSDHLASAITQLEATTKIDPGAIAPKRDLVRLYADLGRDAAALRVSETLSDDAETQRIVARIYSQEKSYLKAAEPLARALKNTPDNRPTAKLAIFREYARILQLAKDWNNAETIWQLTTLFIEDNVTALKAESYDDAELLRERATAFEKLGQCRVEQKKYAEAIAAFNLAALLFKSPKANEPNAAARVNWNLMTVYEAAGDPAKALVCLEEFLLLKPRNVLPYRKLTELMVLNGQAQRIEQRLEAIIAAQPSIDAVKWVLAREIMKRDGVAGNIRFQKMLSMTTQPEFFQLLVKTYSELNHHAELLAIGDILFPVSPEGRRKSIAERTPEEVDRQQAFANALNTQPGIALPLLRAVAAESKPRSAELWELLGWLAERNDLPTDLERSLKASVLAAGNDPSATAFDRLALHYMRHREWQKLLDLCDTIRDFEAYRAILKSDALAELGREDEAFRVLQKTAGLANFSIKRQTAHLHGMLGQYDVMLKKLDAMLDEFTTIEDVKRIRYLRAEAFLGLNRIDDMENELRGLLEHNPDDILALNNLGYNLADRNRKLPESERMIRTALKIDMHNRAKAGDAFPVSGVYLDSLGWVLFRQGKLKEAREELQKATQLPDGRADAIVWDHLGDVCFRMDDKAAAKVAWSNASARYVSDHRGKLLGRADEVKRKLKLCE